MSDKQTPKNPKLRFKREDGNDYPDWQEKKFDRVFQGLRNNTLSRANLSNQGKVKNIHYGDILTILPSIVHSDFEELPYIADSAEAKKYEKAILQNGDVIFADTAEDETAGMAIEIQSCSQPVVSGLHTMPERPVPATFAAGFLGYYLNSNAYHTQLLPLMQGIKVTSISKAAIATTNISVPSLDEQQRIAPLFAQLDALVSATQDEVNGLKELKRTLLKQVFDQTVRFTKEDGTEYPEWESRKFSKVFSGLRNNTLSRANLADKGTVKNIHYGDILTILPSIVYVSEEHLPYIADASIAGKYANALLQNGDVVIADTAEDESAGTAIEVQHCDGSVVAGLHTMAYRPLAGMFAPRFLGYYLNSPAYHHQLLPLMQGIKVTSVSKSAIATTMIAVPCTEEQARIATLFESLDEAIHEAEKELTRYQELKKGLIQKMFV